MIFSFKTSACNILPSYTFRAMKCGFSSISVFTQMYRQFSDKVQPPRFYDYFVSGCLLSVLFGCFLCTLNFLQFLTRFYSLACCNLKMLKLFFNREKKVLIRLVKSFISKSQISDKKMMLKCCSQDI